MASTDPVARAQRVWASTGVVFALSLGACADPAPTVSAPPDVPARGDGGVVVHGSDSADGGPASRLPVGPEVTGSAQPGGERGLDAGRGDVRTGEAIDPQSDGPRGVAEVRDAAPRAAQDAAVDAAHDGLGADARVDAPPDAGVVQVPATTAVQAWAQPLLGRWATRTFYFSQDDFGTVTRAEQLSIAEIVGDGESVVLNSELCLSTIENALSRMRLLDPAAVPVRTEQVRYSEVEQRWRTEGPVFPIGYTREPPPACAGQVGNAVPKLPGQAWLEATCQCSAVVDALEADDCRVVDSDGDGKPGVSYALTLKATGTSTIYYAAMATNSHFVNGQVSADAGVPTASVLADDTPYQFGCSPAGCRNIAALGKACPSPFTRVGFVRLSPSQPVTCDELVSQMSTLFPEPPPSYPTRCL